MIKKIKILVLVAALLAFSVANFAMKPAGAVTSGDSAKGTWTTACNNADLDASLSAEAACDDLTNTSKGITKVGKNILNTVFGLAGIIAVVTIIIGGQRMIMANGDPGKVKAAKDMIMYAVLGLIVVLLSWGIIHFVVGVIPAK